METIKHSICSPFFGIGYADKRDLKPTQFPPEVGRIAESMGKAREAGVNT